MEYPLSFRFKLIALAPQIYVQEAGGKTVCYVKQKLLRLREKVEVFTDDTQGELLATIEADRIIDWSARYVFKTASGREIGSMGRRGMRSLWSAHYEVSLPGGTQPNFTIREENPFAKIGDSLLSEVPLLGMLSGLMFHPRYLATRADGTPVMRLAKLSAFWEGKFELTRLGEVGQEEELTLVLAFLMMNLLERNRG